MKRRGAIEVFARLRAGQPEPGLLVVASVGKGSAQLFAAGHDEATLYNVEMPYPTALGLGLALALPGQRVVVLEGDGSLLSGLGVLTTVAVANPPNLKVIVWDNESYSSIGGLPTATGGVADLEAIAKGAGVRQTTTVRDLSPFEDAVRNALATEGLWLIVAKVEADRFEGESEVTRALPPYPFDLLENAMRFRQALDERGLVPSWRSAASWPASFD